MTATPNPESKKSRPLFPLTMTAVVGGLIAVPVYALTVDGAPEQAPAVAAAEADQAPAGTDDNAASEDGPKSADPMPPGGWSRAGDGKDAAPASAPPPSVTGKTAGRPHRMKGGYAGEGGAIAMDAPAEMAAPGDMDKRVDRDGGRPLGRFIETNQWPDGPGGFDENLQANKLTAGRSSDLQDRTSIDALRALALQQAPQLGQAFASNDRADAAPQRADAPDVLEIGFVLDTTGSMGDELNYLKVEMRSIAKEIGAQFPGVEQRYAVVAYRDLTDDYTVRYHDFESLDGFVSRLGQLQAGGGGDFPEAMDRGMDRAKKLDWSQDSARLVFLVGDAPSHADGYERFADATTSLADRDISVYPVASSGVETICEYMMRWAARTTGGEYIFLTDASGVGNPHADPHLTKFEHSTLRDHMLDVIRMELGNVGGPVVATAQPDNGPAVVNVHVEHHHPSWWDQHGMFVFILGGMFMLGFAGDMASHHARTRRARG